MHVLLGLFLAQAFAATPIHFDQIIMTKDTTQANFESRASKSQEEYCAGVSRGIWFATYQAAVDFDALTDGVYRCDGEFVGYPGQNRLEIFALTKCQLDPNISKSCK